MSCRWRRLMVALVALGATSCADRGPEYLDLWAEAAVLESPAAESLTIEEVTAEPWRSRFTPSPARTLMTAGMTRDLWVRLPLERFEELPGPWVLELASAEIDTLELHVRRPSGWSTWRTGERRPFSTRDLATTTFAFALGPERPEALLAHLSASGAIAVPIRLWSAAEFSRFAGTRDFLLGAFYAFLFALAAYNLFLYGALRERLYLMYVLFILANLLYEMSREGHAARFLWPRWPAWGDLSAAHWLCLMIAAGLYCVRQMTNAAELVPWICRPFRVLEGTYLALLPLLWVSYPLVSVALIWLGLLVSLVAVVPAVVSALRGWHPSRYVLLGQAVMLPGAVLLSLRSASVIGPSFLTEQILKLGAMGGALTYSFALADRITLLRRQREAAQAERTKAERRATELQQDLSRRLIEAQDQERRRLASELHDGLGQDLVVLVNQIKRLRKRTPSGELDELAELASSGVQTVRQVSHALHPSELDRLGLRAAVEMLIPRFAELTGLEVRLEASLPEGKALPRELELHLYRVLQEALTNVARHAEAREVCVALRLDEGQLRLTVRDDGRGFALGEVRQGLGLTSIRERVELIGGALDLDSAAGEGTLLEVTAPLDPPRR